MSKKWRKKLTTYIQDTKEQNESHLVVDSWDDQLDVEEQTSLVEHQQQQEEDSR